MTNKQVREKLIIENRTQLTMREILPFVESVIEDGRISGTGDRMQYCYHTVFTLFNSTKDLVVSAFLNKRSDRFVVYLQEKTPPGTSTVDGG